MKIGVPVKCQNGHRAVWFYSFRGLDVVSEGVRQSEKCACPKHEIGQGYFADGEPFVVVGNTPQWEEAPKICECGPLRNITESGHFPACTRCKRRLRP